MRKKDKAITQTSQMVLCTSEHMINKNPAAPSGSHGVLVPAEHTEAVHHTHETASAQQCTESTLSTSLEKDNPTTTNKSDRVDPSSMRGRTVRRKLFDDKTTKTS